MPTVTPEMRAEIAAYLSSLDRRPPFALMRPDGALSPAATADELIGDMTYDDE